MKNSPLRRHKTSSRDEEAGIVAEAASSYGTNIAERSFQFGLRAIAACRYLERGKDSVARTLARQFLRAATSIGANVEEAQSAESRLDFLHKLRIAQKEARESRYWIRLLIEAEILDNERSESMYRESDEILRVISKIIVNTKVNSN